MAVGFFAGAQRVVGKVANALLEQAQGEHPDNVALSVIDPFKSGPDKKFISHMSADDVRAIVGQIVSATEPAARPKAAAVSQAIRTGPVG
jgi:hypothetical protein